MSFQFSKRSAERMKGVNTDLIKIFNKAIKISPIDFGIPKHGGIRTVTEQNILFNDGLSKCDGYNLKSKHQSGNALDFYAFVDGKASWDKVHLAMVASAILTSANELKKRGEINIDLRWGGTFNSDTFDGWDMPHIEVKL